MRLSVFLAFAVVSATPAMAAAPITGHWLTDDRDGIIEILRCGERVCGRLAKSLGQIKGPLVDRNNPDKSLRHRPIIGLPVLLGLVADGQVWRGQIYDPRHGRHYKATVERIAPDRLKVRGCFSVICRTIMWTRAS